MHRLCTRRALKALTWAVAAVGLTAASDAHADPPALAVARFAWPEGALGTVTYSHTKSPKHGEPPQTLTVTYAVGVKKKSPSGERTITFSNPTVSGALRDAEGVGALVERLQPPMRVNKDGQFIGSPPGSAEALIRAVKLPQGMKLPAEVHDMAVAGLDQRIRHLWDSLVGRWAGKTLSLESTYPVHGETRVLPGVPPLSLTGTGRVSGLSPCPGGASVPQCVEITESTNVSPAGLVSLLKAMAAKVGANMGDISKRLDPKSVSLRWQLVTDPVTLLPRLLRNEREISMSFDGAAPQSEVDIEQWTFSYPAKVP